MNTFKQPQVQQKALQKALKSPFIGKHGKRKTTLLKEEVYKQAQDDILVNVKKLTNKQIELALGTKNGKPNSRVIDSLLNRVFGKPGLEVRLTNNLPEANEDISKMAKLAIRSILDQKNRYN